MVKEVDERWYGRAFLYELVHVLFSGEPDENLLAVLASEDCRATLGTLAGECDAVAGLVDYAAALSDNEAEQVAEVECCRSVFNRTVAGLGAKRISHPWESAYTSSKRLLMQEETLEVRNAYRAFGYLPEMYPKVPDDHLSLECAFMAALAQKSVAALEADDGVEAAALVKGQRMFLENHLLKWIGSYAADLHTDAPGSLYDCAAAALVAFAASDVHFLADGA